MTTNQLALWFAHPLLTKWVAENRHWLHDADAFLASAHDLRDRRCPRCGSPALRPPLDRLQSIITCLSCNHDQYQFSLASTKP